MSCASVAQILIVLSWLLFLLLPALSLAFLTQVLNSLLHYVSCFYFVCTFSMFCYHTLIFSVNKTWYVLMLFIS